jgi:VanZ family protein
MIKRKNLELVTLTLWCLVIFFFSNIPNLSSGLEQDFLLRKIAHVSEFSVLAFLVWLVIKRKKAGQALILLVTFICAFDYAVFDEIHQLFVVGRSGNIFDVGIDSIGILIIVVFLWFRPLENKNKRTAS